MNFLFENYEVKEGLVNFINDRFEPSAVEDYLKSIKIQELNLVLEPSSVYNLIFVTSKNNHDFSSNELDWIKEINSVMAYSVAETTFYFVEICDTLESQYINCAVFIKIVDCLFPGEKCFVFKLASSVSFGYPLVYSSNNSFYDFVLSVEFSNENLELYSEFIEDFSEYGTEMISNYSFDEEDCDEYDKVKYSRDDISFLYEIRSFYGLDISKQLTESECDADHENSIGKIFLHTSALKVLDEVNIDEEISSYDILEQATKAKEKAYIDRTIHSKKSVSLEEKVELEYSEEAFSNAEIMLKEMME